jgi:tetratricopeptide (TPR) repeat protein
MIRSPILLWGVIAMASPVFAQISSSPPPLATAAKQGAQAQYDMLVDLVDSNKMAEALPIAEALETRILATKTPNQTVLASIALLKARAMNGLDRHDEALAIVSRLLDEGRFDAASAASDKYEASTIAGRLNETRLDLDLASRRYTSAVSAAPTPVFKTLALSNLARALVTIDPAKSIEVSDQALALLSDTKENRESRAAIMNLKGRALMNAGRHKDALILLRKVVTGFGGLSVRVDRSDIAARADAALAAFLAGQSDDAREFLAYTGAGRLGGKEFQLGQFMRPPECGGLAQLTPDDVAVIEFSVDDEGAVSAVQPIYTNRPGIGITFARAVKEWRWDPELAKSIKPFFRMSTRLQMSCTNATDRPDILRLWSADYDAWLVKSGVAFIKYDAIKPATSASILRAKLQEYEAKSGPDSIDLIAPLSALTRNGEVNQKENIAYGIRELGIAIKAGAPVRVINYLRARNAMLVNTDGNAYFSARRKQLAALELIAADLTIMRDPRTAVFIHLIMANLLQQLKKFDQSLAAFQRVAAIKDLAEGEPVRTAALIQLASAEQAAGNNAGAKAAFEKSGLSARQCAIADAVPPRISGDVSDDDFPTEALSWGFNGWVVTEYDITAAGKSSSVRPIIAYPPYVFAKAANTLVGRFRFRETFRPDGGLSCGSNNQRTTFRSSP